MKHTIRICKKLFALVALLGMQATAFADCAGGGINVWPRMGTISPNQLFVIEGYGSDQEFVQGLGKNNPAYLVGNGERIALRPIEVCEGEMDIAQVILRADRLLMPGQPYRLWISGIHDDAEADTETKRRLAVMWRPIGFPDMGPPQWRGRPVTYGTYHESYGCGDAAGVRFAISTWESGPCWVRAEMRSMKQSTWTTYYVALSSGIAEIGFDMCAGAFLFREGNAYEIKFTLVDQAGNTTPLGGNPIRFLRPADLVDQPNLHFTFVVPTPSS